MALQTDRSAAELVLLKASQYLAEAVNSLRATQDSLIGTLETEHARYDQAKTIKDLATARDAINTALMTVKSKCNSIEYRREHHLQC